MLPKGLFVFDVVEFVSNLVPVSFSISFPPWSNSVPQFARQRLGGSFGSALHQEGNLWRLGGRPGVEAGGICGGLGGNLGLGGIGVVLGGEPGEIGGKLGRGRLGECLG